VIAGEKEDAPMTTERLFQINHTILPDGKDAEILDQREGEWNSRPGPRVGDFVLIGDRAGRFSHDWGDGMQWSEGGSFYLSGQFVSFSGGLNPSIALADLTPVEETRLGSFWFFHHGCSGAARGVGARIPCRVFRAKTSRFVVVVDNHAHELEAVDRSDAWREGLRLERLLQGKSDCWYPTVVVLPQEG
jgi:hypothetical protein